MNDERQGLLFGEEILEEVVEEEVDRDHIIPVISVPVSDEEKDVGFLFDAEIMEKTWEKEWTGMPEYSHQDLTPVKQLIVSFEKEDDYREFAKLVEQKLTGQTQSIWYPAVKIINVIGVKQYADGES